MAIVEPVFTGQQGPVRLRVTCAPALAPYVCQELSALGYAADQTQRTHVDLSGSLHDAMRLNLHLRTAFHVLCLLKRFECSGPDRLYDEVAALPWEDLIPADGYVSVNSRVRHPSIRDWNYANLKVKDAIVDRIHSRVGRRPDSGPDHRGVAVSLYWHGQTAEMYLNTSGRKLSDRGYRKMPHTAPMQESLAAAVLLATGYDGGQALVNPMCGSGTLAIEAALIATRRAPGLLRGDYSFMHLRNVDAAAWADLRRAAQKMKLKAAPQPIIATDVDERAVASARQNAKTAGVDHLIEFAVCDFADTPVPPQGGIVVLNPEYGKRLGDVALLEATYRRIGAFFKQKCQGCTGYLFTGNLELAKKVGLSAGRRLIFYNARIECRLLRYELYAGSRRRLRK